MSMTRKDFIELAKAMSTARERQGFGWSADSILNHLALDLADFCAHHNGNFDRTKFLDACQPAILA